MSFVDADVRYTTGAPFPALVTGVGPIAINKQNGVWSVAFNMAPLAQQVPPFLDTTHSYTTFWNSNSNAFSKVAFSDILTAVSSAQTQMYPTRIAAAATNIPSFTSWIRTQGYNAIGDGGGALYKKVGGSTAGGFQSADGAWWQLEETVIYPEMFGAVGDGVTNDSPAIQHAHDFLLSTYGGGHIHLRGVTYAVATQLSFATSVGIRGDARTVSRLLGTAAVIMLVWGVTASGTWMIGSIRDVMFEGNNVALAGLVLGTAQNYRMDHVHIQQCVNEGLVLVATQNSLLTDVFVQYCSTNLLLTGGAWNNTFVRFGSNQPTSYHLWSKENTAYEDIFGVSHGQFNRHNVFLNSIMERGTPINIIRLDDDTGNNTFYDMELQGGPSGSGAQIYISDNGAGNNFISGTIQGSGQDYGIENHGFATQVIGVAGSGSWNVNAMQNFGLGSMNAFLCANMFLTTDSHSIESYATFHEGSLAMILSDHFSFTGSGSDGVAGGVPSFKADGTVIPNSDNAFRLGNNVRRWSEMHANYVIGKVYADPSSATETGFNLAPGVAPSSPANGNMWFDGTNVFIRVGGVTKTFTLT
jgi:hypothetical protein